MFKVFFSLGICLECTCFQDNFHPQYTCSLYANKKSKCRYKSLGEKIQCNIGTSIVSSWKSYVHNCSKHDKSL